MEYSNIPGVFDLIQLATASGIMQAVISPGSRNAPLSISLHRHPDIETFVIPDERVAGFFALGLAQQSGVPVILCCTSGSAALNYAPALAEAYYQKVSLLAVTADRPEQSIDQGAGQTIRQRDVFKNYVRHSESLIQDATSASDIESNRQRIRCALKATMNPVKGPVHINFPFSEPLYITREYSAEEHPSTEHFENTAKTEIPVDSLIGELSGQKKILILCGMLEPNEELDNVLGHWADFPQVAILTESTSNLHNAKFLSCIDRLISTFDHDDIEHFQPDLLITIGHQIISKKIKALLSDHKPAHHWHIDPDTKHPNTFQALTRSIFAEPNVVLEALLPQLESIDSDYSEWLHRRDKAIDVAHSEFMDTCPFSDHKAVEAVLNVLPEKVNFHIGNSASVRYVQLFKQGRTVHCNSNRGTSGIDGCTSTAMGAATSTGQPTVLLTGDMAFLYDSNAFWHPHIPENFKIIVLNNGGGGIFRIIDGPREPEEVERYFEAHHQQTAKNVAAMYNIPYADAHSIDELSQRLESFFDDKSGMAILEIFTPRLENDRVLKDYFRHLQKARTESKVISNE